MGRIFKRRPYSKLDPQSTFCEVCRVWRCQSHLNARESGLFGRVEWAQGRWSDPVNRGIRSEECYTARKSSIARVTSVRKSATWVVIFNRIRTGFLSHVSSHIPCPNQLNRQKIHHLKTRFRGESAPPFQGPEPSVGSEGNGSSC